MMDAMISDFTKTDCNRIIAIGGGAVIDMAKRLVLEGTTGRKTFFKKCK